MSFKTARESFEQAQQIAEAAGDSTLEFLAAGLADLAKSMATELRAVQSRLNDVENKVRSLR